MSHSGTSLSGQESSDQLYALNRSRGNSFEDSRFTGGASLSMDFSAPLTEQARAERIKQMSKNHPAFEKTRIVQETLHKVQTSLRRMPGVSATESNEIITKLQEVAQLISQETSQLVDAIMNLTLDSVETDKAVARMGLEASLTKASLEDKAQTVRDREKELKDERSARAKAENEVKKIMEEMQDLSSEFSQFKNKARNGSPSSQEDMIKNFESIIQHLEDQVNNRRSLWVMKHKDPAMIAQAIETMADSLQDKSMLKDSISSLRAASGQHHIGSHGDFQPPHRAPSAFQHIDRPSTAHQTGYSPLQAGPPRAPSTRPQSRHFQGWGSSNGNGNTASTRSVSSALTSPSAFPRAPSRRGYQTQPRYRPNAPEFQPSMFAQRPPSRPGTAFGHNRNRYSGRMQDSFDSGFGSINGGAMVPRNTHRGPLIHLTERSVAAWSKQVSDFYSVIRRFVDRHASQPIYDADHLLSETDLWPILVRTYLPLSEMEAASYLQFHLKDQNAKRCLVTRVVIDYVVNLVWVPGAWKSADRETTYALAELERELIQTRGQPSSVRQPLLDKQASILDTIMKNHDPNSEFYKTKTSEIAGTLLTSLQPVLDPLASVHDAYGDLAAVADQAWDLSSKILTSRLTFDFRFPEIGCRFSSQSMVPIWPADVDPMELQAKHWRVAMVTTPVITCRNDTGTNISAHSVALADVICMQ